MFRSGPWRTSAVVDADQQDPRRHPGAGCNASAVPLAGAPEALAQLPARRRSWCCSTCTWAATIALTCTPRCASAGARHPPDLGSRPSAMPRCRQVAERGWGFLAKPVRAPALRALVSQTLLRLQERAPS